MSSFSAGRKGEKQFEAVAYACVKTGQSQREKPGVPATPGGGLVTGRPAAPGPRAVACAACPVRPGDTLPCLLPPSSLGGFPCAVGKKTSSRMLFQGLRIAVVCLSNEVDGGD